VTTSAERDATTDDARAGAAEAALTRLLLLARADLAAQVRTDDCAETMAGRVLELVLRLVPGAEHAAVSLAGDEPGCVAATAEAARECETAQFAAGAGPLLDVVAGMGAVRCDDLAADARWPEFAAAATAAGMRCLLACELAVGRSARGALTVYATEPHVLSEVSELVLPMFAARAGMALAYADKMDNLRRAIDTRQVIGQACGILMERRRISSEQAFAELVAVSQRHHLKLRELAVRVVESGQDPAEAALN
jgi:transcriptional regulator with GAF, ATPase, and Fis domain